MDNGLENTKKVIEGNSMFEVGDKVRVIRPCFDAQLEKDEIYSVAVVVIKGKSYYRNGVEQSGIIIRHLPKQPYMYSKHEPYPFIWDFNRFEKVK